MRFEWEMLSMSLSRSSITSHIPMFDFEAKPISALVFDIQLNMVVFPVLERPMIPQLSAIVLSFNLLQKYKNYRLSPAFQSICLYSVL